MYTRAAVTEGVPHPCLRKLAARRPSAPGLLSQAVSPMHQVRFLQTIICFCIGAVAPLAMVGWILAPPGAPGRGRAVLVKRHPETGS